MEYPVNLKISSQLNWTELNAENACYDHNVYWYIEYKLFIDKILGMHSQLAPDLRYGEILAAPVKKLLSNT